VGPNFTRPTAPPAARYTGDTPRGEDATASDTAQHIALGREIEGNWWALFRSDAIDQLVKQAVEHNRSLAASKATLAQAQETCAGAGGLTGTRKWTSPPASDASSTERSFWAEFGIPPFTYFAVGPTSATRSTIPGASRAAWRSSTRWPRWSAPARCGVSDGHRPGVLQTLAIASARAQIATVETILVQDRDNLRLVQTAFDNGSVAREGCRERAEPDRQRHDLLPSLRQDLARARHALSVVLGRVPASELPPDVDLAQITLPLEVPVSLPQSLPSPARHSRRGGATACGDQRRGGRAIQPLSEDSTERDGGPTITQGGPVVRPASNAWSIISGLTAPIFDGGTLRAEKRAAVDAMHASAASYEQTVLEAFAQVADLLEALDHDAQQLDAQAQAQQAAQSSLDLARASYSEGNAGVLLVLDAERSYQQARLGYVRAWCSAMWIPCNSSWHWAARARARLRRSRRVDQTPHSHGHALATVLRPSDSLL